MNNHLTKECISQHPERNQDLKFHGETQKWVMEGERLQIPQVLVSFRCFLISSGPQGITKWG